MMALDLIVSSGIPRRTDELARDAQLPREVPEDGPLERTVARTPVLEDGGTQEQICRLMKLAEEFDMF
jgi:hypothetical protein